MILRRGPCFTCFDFPGWDVYKAARRALGLFVPKFRYTDVYKTSMALAAQIKIYQEELQENNPTATRQQIIHATHAYFQTIPAYREIREVYPEIVFGTPWNGFYSFLDKTNNECSFPSGLLHRFSLPHTIEDVRSAPVEPPAYDYTLNAITLRDYQQEAIKAALDAQQGIIGMSVSGGKTALIASLCKNFPNSRVLILYMSTDLIKQTHDELSRFLNDNIGAVYSAQQCPSRITILGVQYAITNLAQLMPLLQEQDVIICDEVHHSQSKSYTTLLRTCPAWYRFGLSGTPRGNDVLSEWGIEAFLGPVIHQTSTQELQEAGYVAKVHTTLIQNPKVGYQLPPTYSSSRKIYLEHYRKGIVENDYRNQLIIDLAQKLATGVLIMVDYIEHGKLLAEALSAPFVYGQIKSGDTRKGYFKDFDDGEIPILIANKVAGEGVNIINIRHLIYAAGGKSIIKVLQTTGRAIRKKGDDSVAHIYDFTDPFSKYLKQHAIQRGALYQKRGDTIEVLDEKKFRESHLFT